MVTADLGYGFPELFEGSRAWVGLDYATGDESTGGDVQTFNQLFPLGHAYLGFADAIGRQNIIDTRVGLDSKLSEKWSTNLHYHAFWVADKADALYNVGGGVSRAGGAASSRYVGSEVDLIATYKSSPHMVWQFGYAHVFAGSLIEDTGPSDDIDFAYAQLQLRF